MEKQENEIEQVGITVWPGRKLPAPEIDVYPAYLDGEFLKYATYAPGKKISLAEDFYLRELRELDLTSHQDVAKFCGTFGRMGSPRWRDLPVPDLGVKMSKLAKLDKTYAPLALIDRQQQQYVSSLEFEHPMDEYDHVSIDYISLHVKALRDTVRIWLSRKGEIGFDEVLGQWENGVWPPPRDLDSGAGYLKAFLNAGLKPFHVHLVVSYPDGRDPETAPSLWRDTSPSLYSAICLQLANDIVEDSTYRRCANESCGRIFSKQRGRSVHGFHKTKGEIYYCDKWCAKAQAQRGLRRRQKEALRLKAAGRSTEVIAKALDTDPEAVKRWLVKPEPKKRRKDG